MKGKTRGKSEAKKGNGDIKQSVLSKSEYHR